MPCSDLTRQFYGLYMLEFVIRSQLKQSWKSFLCLPEEEQHLEKGCSSMYMHDDPLPNVTVLRARSCWAVSIAQ